VVVTERTKELLAEAVLSEDARDFLASDLGQMLVGQAKQDEEACARALLDVDPSDAAAIRTLQFQAHVARSVVRYIGEVISRGQQAMSELELYAMEEKQP
jgi:hypothetical protein